MPKRRRFVQRQAAPQIQGLVETGQRLGDRGEPVLRHQLNAALHQDRRLCVGFLETLGFKRTWCGHQEQSASTP
jgi:hypothetical protein